MAIGVYKITSPKGKVYVGSSTNIQKRFETYKRLNCKSQKKLYASFIKYGVENHNFEIILECETDVLLRYETLQGIKFNVLDRNDGLNLMLPKIDGVYGGVSNEAKKRMSDSSKGQIAWNKGIPCSEEMKTRISKKLKGITAWNKGMKWDNETKKKMSDSSKGSVPVNKKIILDTSNGVFYDSITQASTILGIKRTTLSSMLLGVNKNKTNLIIT